MLKEVGGETPPPSTPWREEGLWWAQQGRGQLSTESQPGKGLAPQSNST